jgi:RES domain
VRFRHVTRSGRFVRVAQPDWRRPLDPGFAAERGGRWNPPASFPVVYLCATPEVARRVVVGRFEGLPYGVLDLQPDRRPVLIETDVPTHRAVDVVTAEGCRAASLPPTYPYDARGRKIGWERTRPIGERAWEGGERSIACRSAAVPKGRDGEELVWFVRERTDRLTVSVRRSFDDWFSRVIP